MDEDFHWREADTFAARMNWARRRLRDIQGEQRLPTIKAAADFLGIKPGTYRTYEVPKENDGRVPPLQEIQRIARRLAVSWKWLALNEGEPDEGVLPDERFYDLQKKIQRLPQADRDTAIEAAHGVVDSFTRRR